MTCLEVLSNIASIVTAAVAFVAYVRYTWNRRERRLSLEKYLREEKAEATGGNRGQRSALHVMRNTKLSEAEIFQAARDSKVIGLRTRKDETTNLATDLLFEYEGKQKRA
jgi:hypothetical protein